MDAINSSSSISVSSGPQKDVDTDLYDIFSSRGLHNIATSLNLASNLDTSMSGLLASSGSRKRNYTKVDDSLTSCIRSEINDQSTHNGSNTINRTTDILNPSVGLHQLLVRSNYTNDEVLSEEVCS